MKRYVAVFENDWRNTFTHRLTIDHNEITFWSDVPGIGYPNPRTLTAEELCDVLLHWEVAWKLESS